MAKLNSDQFPAYVSENAPEDSVRCVLSDGLAVYFRNRRLLATRDDGSGPVEIQGVKNAIAFVELDVDRIAEFSTKMSTSISGKDMHPWLRGRFYIRKLAYNSDTRLCVATLDSHGEVFVVMDTGEGE